VEAAGATGHLQGRWTKRSEAAWAKRQRTGGEGVCVQRQSQRKGAANQCVLRCGQTQPHGIEQSRRISETIVPLLFHSIELLAFLPRDRHVRLGRPSSSPHVL